MNFENDVFDELQTIAIQIFSMGLPTNNGDTFSNIGATINNWEPACHAPVPSIAPQDGAWDCIKCIECPMDSSGSGEHHMVGHTHRAKRWGGHIRAGGRPQDLPSGGLQGHPCPPNGCFVGR